MSGGEALSGAGGRTAGRSAWGALPAALLPALLLAAVVGSGLWGYSYDDAFITYRYADHLSHGQGLVYNSGERVLGTTAPGWAVLLAAAERVGRTLGLAADLPPSVLGDGGLDVAGWGTLLCLASLAWLTAVLPFLALRRAPPPWTPWRWAFPALLSSLAFLAPWNLELLGAETFPVLALGATAIWLALDPGEPASRDAVAAGREVGAGLLMAAAMVLRLDAALGALALGLVLTVVGWRSRRRLPWRYAVCGIAPVALWLYALSARFGTFLPHTLAGKRSEAAISSAAGWIGYTVAEARWLLRDLPPYAAVLLALLALAGAVLLLRGALRWRHAVEPGGEAFSLAGGRPLLLALAGWVLLQELAYRAVGVPFAPWYSLHLLLAALALAAHAALAAGRRLAQRLPTAPSWSAPPLAAALLLPILLPGAQWLAATWGQPPDVRTAVYGAIGDYLREHSRPTDVVAAVEIGALGYVADRPVLDLMGLVSPPALDARLAGQLPSFVSYRAPRYLVVPPHFRPGLLDPILTHPDVAGRYRPTARFDHPGFLPGPVQLYECRTCP